MQLSGLGWVLNTLASVYKGREGKTQRHRREGLVVTEVERGVMQPKPRNDRSRQKLERARKSPLELSEGV